MTYSIVVLANTLRKIIRNYGPRMGLKFSSESERIKESHMGVVLTFTRSVMGSAIPCAPRSSKYGEDEKVVAWEVRTILNNLGTSN
jgi:hypothetical protein